MMDQPNGLQITLSKMNVHHHHLPMTMIIMVILLLFRMRKCLLKIMMLSVTKRTSSRLKFWLFENYLSPSFKSSARHMTNKIGCDVEFVTRKWPERLRGQSEKQRIVWGHTF